MIEALESFRQGWGDTNAGMPFRGKTRSKGEVAFHYFFGHNEEFKDFRRYPQEFYKHIRCGILHQAESTGGWRITRKGPLFDAPTKTINATLFLNKLRKSLEGYCEELKSSDWNSPLWDNLRKKMQVICENCR
jgi:hypothetical protein